MEKHEPEGVPVLTENVSELGLAPSVWSQKSVSTHQPQGQHLILGESGEPLTLGVDICPGLGP